ncbi:MAG: DUF2779 domain-containing protein [Campylobacterales bacterium]
MTLSKSQFIRGTKCHKSLWLYKNRPELREQPDSSQEALFDTGYQVGDMAKMLFLNGVEIEFDTSNFDGMEQKTKELIDSGEKTIYEATFKKDCMFAMADILHRGENGWEVYEVKASTRVKDYHELDAAFQYRLLSRYGLDISKVGIVHIDNSYVLGDMLEIEKLFTIADITDRVIELQNSVEYELEQMESMLEGDEPDIDIGSWCSKYYGCDFGAHCWSHIPKRSVFNLYRLNGDKKFELYYKRIINLDEIPKDYPLSKLHKLQVEKNEYIDKEVIGTFLDSLIYPINYFDFETFSDGVPRFKGQRPYTQIPFQYSLHIDYGDGSLEHREFLAKEGEDPRKEIAEAMLRDIPKTGSIVAYNQGFEIGRIKELAEFLPHLKEELLSLNNRFIDLIVPFRRLGYYHPEFNGSFSIKSVLPAMFRDDSELSYKSLNIQDGGSASAIYGSLHLLKDKSKLEAIRDDLLAYCKLDTLAMVKIVEKLKTYL